MSPLGLVISLLFFQAPAPSFTVAGTIVDGVTGAPLAKARLTLAGSPEPFVTGVDGRFRFEGVAAGKHQLRAERLGYTIQSFGQRALSTRYSTAIITGADQPTGNLVFRMIPGAVIEGYARDPNGEPAVGMRVEVVRINGFGQARRAGRTSSTSTDDRGYFRLRQLAAGTYAVIVAGQSRREVASVQPMAYPVTFYPGVTDPSAAGFLTVKAGEEASADVVLHPVPAVHLEGEVPSLAQSPGARTAHVAVSAPSLLGTFAPVVSAYVNRGKFIFPNLAAGHYHLRLVRGAEDSAIAQLLGVLDVDATSDPTPVTIPDAVPLRVSIHLTVTGTPKLPGSPLRATLAPVDGIGSTLAQIGPDGRGVFIGYPAPGRSTILAVQGRPLAVTSFAVNGTPQPSMVFDVPETGSVEIEAIANATTVDVSGRVVRDDTPESGILVALMQRDTWQQIGIYRADQSDSDGTFSWRDLPPGEYLAFALEQGVPEDYDDPEVIRTLLPIAQPLTLTGAPVQQVELKVLPLPAK